MTNRSDGNSRRDAFGKALSYSLAAGVNCQVIADIADVDGPPAQFLQQRGWPLRIADGDVGMFKKIAGLGKCPVLNGL